jgi:dTDP-4-amino-4,6-dideoxygalactose transaminase
MGRIHLSPPDVSEIERDLLLEAFDASWVAPAGPDLPAFEAEFCTRIGVAHGAALSSGTAALHLALITQGVGPGDEVIVPSLTFAATANAVRYVGADPIFVDSERSTWNLDPDLVTQTLEQADRDGRRIGAVLTVDVFGQCADHGPITDACSQRGIPVIEDAAEAVGASWHGEPAGSLGDVGVFSFNGNKLLTTGGGGMLVSADAEVVERARHLATQARLPALHYEHVEVGYNYRLSNLLAAIGRGQVRRLDELLARRRTVFERYSAELADLPGVSLAPIDPRGTSNHWLTILVLDDDARAGPGEVIEALAAVDAEARPTWKPMHLQPAWQYHPMVGGDVSADVFARGACLPSGSSLTEPEQSLVIDTTRKVLGGD